MTLRKARSRPRLIAAASIAVAAMVVSAPGHAQRTAGLFEAWAGAWAGNGTISTSDGGRERIRCNVTYAVQAGGSTVKQDLRCASDAYRFEITSNIIQQGQTLTGDWFEGTRRVGGRIVGHASGNQLDIRAEGDTFTALVTVNTQGNRQTFVLESPGSQLASVSITLDRAAR